MRGLAFILAVLGSLTIAVAQEAGSEDNSFFIRLLEDQLSSESRQIRLKGIEGLLSSEASVAQITISDTRGVWLRIENAKVVWYRTQLLKGRLNIEHLSAERIIFSRLPEPEEGGLPSPESRAFRLPELPVAVRLAALDIASFEIDKAVFGLDVKVRASGAFNLEDGEMIGALAVDDLTGAGGQMILNTSFSNDTGFLDVDFTLIEQENGIVANLLNLEGRPPVALRLKGAGPVENLDLALSLDLGTERIVEGFARFRGEGGGLRFDVGVSAALKDIVPDEIARFFGEKSELSAGGVTKPEGGLRIDTFSVASEALSFNGAAEFSGDGFLERLEIRSKLGVEGDSTPLPFGDGEIEVASATLDLTYVPSRTETWGGRLEIRQFKSPEFAARQVRIDYSGVVRGLSEPENRLITFNIEGAVEGITSDRPEITEALGDRVTLSVDGAWNSGGPVVVRDAQISGASLDISAEGDIRGLTFDGFLQITSNSIAPFSRLLRRNLAGGLDLSVVGSYALLSGAFDLTVGGLAQDLRLDIAVLDPLLVGQTALQGQIARTEEGLFTDGFLLDNDQIELTSSGQLTSTSANLEITGELTDLGLITDRATGPLRLIGMARGEGGNTSLNVRLGVPVGTILSKPLVGAELEFIGNFTAGRLTGVLNGLANLESFAVELSTRVAADRIERVLTDLVFRTEGAVLTGSLRETSEGLFEGEVLLDASDISTAATLLLQSASGSARGKLELSHESGRQEVRAELALDNLVLGSAELSQGRLNVHIRDAFGVPKISGTTSANRAVIGGVSVADFTASAANQGAATVFRANALLDNGTRVNTQGTLDEIDGGFRLDLTALNLVQGELTAGLSYPSIITVANGEVRVETLALKVGDGEIRASGVVSDTYGLAITLDAVPLSIANAVRPDLGLAGSVSGSGAMYGKRTDPDIFLDLKGTGVRSNILNSVGMAAFNFDALATSNQKNGVDLNVRFFSPDGVSVRLTGDIPFNGTNMALSIDLERFPLGVFNRLTGNRGLGGAITGRASVSGNIRRPTASFEIAAEGVTLREVQMANLAPLQAEIKGRYLGRSLEIQAGHVTGANGLSVDVSGFIALPSSGLDFNISGSVPMSAIVPVFFRRGTTTEGLASADLDLRGHLGKPRVSGQISTSGAVVTDPPSNLRVEDLALQLQVTDNRVSVVRAQGNFAGGGRISVTGTLDINVAAGLPANLQLEMRDVVYSNRRFLITRFDADLGLSGPLARGPLVTGKVRLQETELSIASGFGLDADILDVAHRNAPAGVLATERRLRKVNREGTARESQYPVQLDLTVQSDNRIFVRGRGLDAELGGEVNVSGPIDDFIPEGGFQLIRGRMNILAQRITLDEGQVTLIGDLDPELRFLADVSNGDLVASILLTGRASDPQLEITSNQDLPEDEILARLVFDRSVGELSPFQLASLASALAELAGGRGVGFLGNLRQATGLDDLDISSDEGGNAVVQAGKYVDEKVYLGIEAGTEGSTRATINLDLTDTLRARGSVGSDGESSIGLFFERDY